MIRDTPIGSYKNATGPINYGMTNDYMFRAVLQKNVHVLKGLICSVLHLREENVQSVQITNPIELGDDIDDKTFILDVNVLLNNNTLINLEMQMTNEHNWTDRSLSYLCRSYDQLYQGEIYSSAKPAIHIGFLNFQPFPDYPEFYAKYKLMNEKNGMVYSDKFLLNVIDLTQIELATEEDKEYQIDYWARLFTATSWEEIIMLAEKNNAFSETAQTLYELNSDEITEMKCRARRDYYKQKNTTEKIMNELTLEKDRLLAETEKLTAETEQLTAQKEQLTAQTEQLTAQTEQLTAENEALSSEVKNLKARIAELEAQQNK